MLFAAHFIFVTTSEYNIYSIFKIYTPLLAIQCFLKTFQWYGRLCILYLLNFSCTNSFLLFYQVIYVKFILFNGTSDFLLYSISGISFVSYFLLSVKWVVASVCHLLLFQVWYCTLSIILWYKFILIMLMNFLMSSSFPEFRFTLLWFGWFKYYFMFSLGVLLFLLPNTCLLQWLLYNLFNGSLLCCVHEICPSSTFSIVFYQLVSGSFWVSLFIDLGCPWYLGTGWRDFGTYNK